MFFRDLKFKRARVLDVSLTNVHLPVRLGHRDAGKLFVEPLKAQLAAAALGTVIDCKLRTRGSGDVIGVDLYLGLRDTSKAALKTVTGMLEALAAPIGSSIRLSDSTGVPLLFGRTEGLELAVNIDAVPDAGARRELALACRGAIEDIGVNRGWVEAKGKTRFFFYSEDLLEMQRRLADVLHAHPRFSAARVKRLA